MHKLSYRNVYLLYIDLAIKHGMSSYDYKERYLLAGLTEDEVYNWGYCEAKYEMCMATAWLWAANYNILGETPQ